MESERKVIKFVADIDIDDSEEIRSELASAMLENKRIKRLADLFLLALFLLLITYTTL
jgi:hypothetical protein